MSELVVSWQDDKGNNYHARTVWNTETGEFYDWNGTKGEFVIRLNTGINKVLK